MPDTFDVLVVGAGVIGLAVGAELARRGREVVVVDEAATVGSGESSRNSEVIHAGLYYTPGSLKARACRAGRDRLVRYLAERGIDHRVCGKLVIAAEPDEIRVLEALHARGTENGVTNLRLIDGAEVRALEPNVRCVAALDVRSTGILDSHGYLLALQADLERGGGFFVPGTRVESIDAGDRAATVVLGDGAVASANRVLVTAGLGTQSLLVRSGYGELVAGRVRRVQGRYLSYGRPAPFGRLVYPLPVPGGLGIHFTLDLAGQGRFGPDALEVEAPRYDVDPAIVPAFAASVRRWFPDLEEEALAPAYAGVRDQPTGGDFILLGPEETGSRALVAALGIESPGLTASLVLGEWLADLAESGEGPGAVS